jgi:hypothetical protein
MTLFYSPSNAGFYDDEIHTTIPSDGVEITKSEHTALLTAQSEGRVICVGEDGKPTTKLPDKPDLPTYKRQAKDKIDGIRKDTEEKGLTYVFPDEVTDVIQLRNNRDLLNVSSMVTSAQLLKASGFTGTMKFQAESNTTHEMTADELITMGLEVGFYIQSLYTKAWPIKAAIDAAADYDEVDALAVWPE